MKLVRISSGEEVIGDITETTDTVTIKKGYVLIPGGEGKIAFMPFMPYTKSWKEGLEINKSNILFVADPVDELVAQVESVRNPKKIITPKKQDIIV